MSGVSSAGPNWHALAPRLARVAAVTFVAVSVAGPIFVLAEQAHRAGPLAGGSGRAVLRAFVDAGALAIAVASVATLLAWPIARAVSKRWLLALALTSPIIRALAALGWDVRPGFSASALAWSIGTIPLAALVVRLRADRMPGGLLSAAADLGASARQRWWWIEAPWLRPAWVIAFGWCALQVLGDAVIVALAGGGKVWGPGLLARDALLRDEAPARALWVVLALVAIATAVAWAVARQLLPAAPTSTSRREAVATSARGHALYLVTLLPLLGLLPAWRFPLDGRAAGTLLELGIQTSAIGAGVAILAATLGWLLALGLPRDAHPLYTAAALVPVAMPSSVQGALALAMATRFGMGPGTALTTFALVPTATALAFLVSRLELAGVPAVLRVASADLGAGMLARLRWLWWPATRRAWYAAALLALAWVLGEAAIPAFTSGPGGSTLAMGLMVVMHSGDVGTVARFATVLVLVPLAIAALYRGGASR